VEFNANTLALNQFNPLANFALPPSGDTIMFFLTGTAVMNYAPGFDTGFSFFYTTVSFSGSASVYDGLNATGNLLGTIQLDALGRGPVPAIHSATGGSGTLPSTELQDPSISAAPSTRSATTNITFGSIDPTGFSGGSCARASVPDVVWPSAWVVWWCSVIAGGIPEFWCRLF
jgi:hypothetical protein